MRLLQWVGRLKPANCVYWITCIPLSLLTSAFVFHVSYHVATSGNGNALQILPIAGIATTLAGLVTIAGIIGTTVSAFNEFKKQLVISSMLALLSTSLFMISGLLLPPIIDVYMNIDPSTLWLAIDVATYISLVATTLAPIALTYSILNLMYVLKEIYNSYNESE